MRRLWQRHIAPALEILLYGTVMFGWLASNLYACSQGTL